MGILILVGEVNGQNQSSTDKYMVLIEDPWAFSFAAVGAAGSLATAGAIFFLYRQSQHTKEENEFTLRPWIGFTDFEISHGKMNVKCMNYGRLPAKIIGTYEFVSNSKISREQLRSAKNGLKGEYFIFPNSEEKHEFDKVIPDNAFAGLIIKYTYAGKKKAESGIIAQYFDSKKIFEVIEVFAI